MLVKKKCPLLAFETIAWIMHHQVHVVCRNNFFSRKRNHAITTIVIITIMCSFDSDKSFGKLEILNYSLFHWTKKTDSESITMIVVKTTGLDISRSDTILYFFLNVIWNIYRTIIAALLNEVLHDYQINFKHILFLFSPWFMAN